MDGQELVPEVGNSDVTPTSGSEEKIMLQLDDAAQLVFQEQSEEGSTEDSAEPSVTYQIIAQQMTESGEMQLTLSDGVNIIQTTMATDQLQSLEENGAGILLHDPDSQEQTTSEFSQESANSSQVLPASTDSTQAQISQADISSVASSQSENLLHIDILADSSQPVNMLEVLNNPSVTLMKEPLDNDGTQESEFTDLYTTTIDKVKAKRGRQVIICGDDDDKDADPDFSLKDKVEKTKEEKQPDLTQPIEVTDHMEVMVKGKKCLLKVNPDTGQLCAYPLIKPGRKRGRPRKIDTGEMLESPKPADNIDSAAEGLLELSNTGPDGIRRSNRRNRGKPKTMNDYEVFEVSSDDDAAIDDGEDEVLPSGAVRKRRVIVQEYIPPVPVPTPGTVKRGRGRPRRYPRPDDVQPVNQIPAMIIPSSDGQTIMMAPIQGVSNLEEFQDQIKNLTFIQTGANQGGMDDGSQYLNLSGIMDSTGDGTMVSIQLENLTADGSVVMRTGAGDSIVAAGTNIVAANTSALTGDNPEAATTSTLDVPAAVADDQLDTDDVDVTAPNKDCEVAPSVVTTEASITGSDALLTEGKEIPTEPSVVLSDLTNTEDAEPPSEILPTKPETSQPTTIIRIPENLLPMFTQRKEPATLGLKASDIHLEKLKCSKCDFQGYYEQQYQDHIATHSDDTHKCKCCKFAAFEKEELIQHFKKNHPRCICNFCDHMAEQAYIIKRHMMRHTQEGCKCDLCGKVYKDQYVLKMHVKMVHMPAEVLFECNICSKKFTRKAHLKRHLRIHDPEKPYKCPHPQCTYRGVEKSDISKHVLIHEEPKHVCNVCNKAFRHSKNKDIHMKRHSGQRDYKCGVCDFYGYTFTDIRKHIERKHTDNRTYVCDRCGTLFRTETAYREHRSQPCDMIMIEQALAIATSDGGTTQATIQIPSSSFTMDTQHIQVEGQSVSIDKHGQITIGQPVMPGVGITLTEEQIQAVASGDMTEVDIQNLVAQNQLNVGELQSVVSQDVINDEQTDAGEIMQDIDSDAPQLQTYYKGLAVEATATSSPRPELMYKTEDDVTLTEEEEEEESMEEGEGELEGGIGEHNVMEAINVVNEHGHVWPAT